MSNSERDRGPSIFKTIFGLGLTAGAAYGGYKLGSHIYNQYIADSSNVVHPNSTLSTWRKILSPNKKFAASVAKDVQNIVANKLDPGRNFADVAYSPSQSINPLHRFAMQYGNYFSRNVPDIPNLALDKAGAKRGLSDIIRARLNVNRLARGGQNVIFDAEWFNAPSGAKDVFHIGVRGPKGVVGAYVRPSQSIVSRAQDILSLNEMSLSAIQSLPNATGHHISLMRDIQKFSKASGRSIRSILTGITTTQYTDIMSAFKAVTSEAGAENFELFAARGYEDIKVLANAVRGQEGGSEFIQNIRKRFINLQDITSLSTAGKIYTPNARLEAYKSGGLSKFGESPRGLWSQFKEHMAKSKMNRETVTIRDISFDTPNDITYPVSELIGVGHAGDIDVAKEDLLLRQFQNEMPNKDKLMARYIGMYTSDNQLENRTQLAKELAREYGGKTGVMRFTAKQRAGGSAFTAKLGDDKETQILSRGDMVYIHDVRPNAASGLDINLRILGDKLTPHDLTITFDDEAEAISQLFGSLEFNRINATNVYEAEELIRTTSNVLADPQETFSRLISGAPFAKKTLIGQKIAGEAQSFVGNVAAAHSESIAKMQAMAEKYGERGLKPFLKYIFEPVYNSLFSTKNKRMLPDLYFPGTNAYNISRDRTARLLRFKAPSAVGVTSAIPNSMKFEITGKEGTKVYSLYDALAGGHITSSDISDMLSGISEEIRAGGGKPASLQSMQIKLLSQISKMTAGKKIGPNGERFIWEGSLKPMQEFMEKNLEALRSVSEMPIIHGESIPGVVKHDIAIDDVHTYARAVRDAIGKFKAEGTIYEVAERVEKVQGMLSHLKDIHGKNWEDFIKYNNVMITMRNGGMEMQITPRMPNMSGAASIPKRNVTLQTYIPTVSDIPMMEYISIDHTGMGKSRKVTTAFGDIIVDPKKLAKDKSLSFLHQPNVGKAIPGFEHKIISGREVADLMAKEEMRWASIGSARMHKITESYEAGLITPNEYKTQMESVARKYQRRINDAMNAAAGVGQNVEFPQIQPEAARAANNVRLLKGHAPKENYEGLMTAAANMYQANGEYAWIEKGHGGRLRKGIGLREMQFLGTPPTHKFQERFLPREPSAHLSMDINLFSVGEFEGKFKPEDVGLAQVTSDDKPIAGLYRMTNRRNRLISIPMTSAGAEEYFGYGRSMQQVLSAGSGQGEPIYLAGSKGVIGRYIGDRLPGHADYMLGENFDDLVGTIANGEVKAGHGMSNKIREGIIGRIMHEQNQLSIFAPGQLMYDPEEFSAFSEEMKRAGVLIKQHEYKGHTYLTATDIVPRKIESGIMTSALSPAQLEEQNKILSFTNLKKWYERLMGADRLKQERFQLITTSPEGNKFLNIVSYEGAAIAHSAYDRSFSDLTIPGMKSGGYIGALIGREEMAAIAQYDPSGKLGQALGREVVKMSSHSTRVAMEYSTALAGYGRAMSGEAIPSSILEVEYANAQGSFLERISAHDYDERRLLSLIDQTDANTEMTRESLRGLMVQDLFPELDPVSGKYRAVRIKNIPVGYKGPNGQITHDVFLTPTRANVVDDAGRVILTPGSAPQLKTMAALISSRQDMSDRLSGLYSATMAGMLEEYQGKRGLAAALSGKVSIGDPMSFRKLTKPGESGFAGLWLQSNALADKEAIEILKKHGVRWGPNSVLIHPRDVTSTGLFTEKQVSEGVISGMGIAIKHPTAGIADTSVEYHIATPELARELGIAPENLWMHPEAAITRGIDFDKDRVSMLMGLQRGPGGNSVSTELNDAIKAVQAKRHEILGKAFFGADVGAHSPAEIDTIISEIEKQKMDSAKALESIFGGHRAERMTGIIGNYEKDMLNAMLYPESPFYISDPVERTKAQLALFDLKENIIKSMKTERGLTITPNELSRKLSSQESVLEYIDEAIANIKGGSKPIAGSVSAERMVDMITTLRKKIAGMSPGEYQTYNTYGGMWESLARKEITPKVFEGLHSKGRIPLDYTTASHTDDAIELGYRIDDKVAAESLSWEEMFGVGKIIGGISLAALAANTLVGLFTPKEYTPNVKAAQQYTPSDPDYYRTVIEVDAMDEEDMDKAQMQQNLSNSIGRNGNANVHIRDDRQDIRNIMDTEIINKLRGF